MTKETSVWAIKLGPTHIELRATKGPVKLIHSSLKKTVKVTIWNTYSFTHAPVLMPITLKQTSLVGGRFLGTLSPGKFHAVVPGDTKFGREDVIKLSPEQTKVVLSKWWRRQNL